MNFRDFVPSWIKEMIDYLMTKKRIPTNVILHKTSKIYPGVRIGDYSFINGNSYIFSGTIGKYCSIGRNVQISPPEHPIEWVSTSQFFYKNKGWKEIPRLVEIGNDVWIGSNAVILSGVKIGTGAVVAAGAVVTKDVPPYTVVGGVPAKVLKARFSAESAAQLLNSEWWNLDFEVLSGLDITDTKQFIQGMKERNKNG